MNCNNGFYAREKSNSLNDVMEPNQILVCSTGDSWDVAVIINDGEVETHWYEKNLTPLERLVSCSTTCLRSKNSASKVAVITSSK